MPIPDGSNPEAVAADAEGRTLIAYGSGQTGTSVLRLLPDGSPDPSFGNGGTVASLPGSDVPVALRPRADGSVAFAEFADGALSGYTVILDEAGTPIGGGGITRADLPVQAVTSTPSGETLVAGTLGEPEPGGPKAGFFIEKFQENGSVDRSWGNAGIVEGGESMCVGSDPSCRIVHYVKRVTGVKVATDGSIGVSTNSANGVAGHTPGAGLYSFGGDGSALASASDTSSIALFTLAGLTTAGNAFVTGYDVVRDPEVGFRVGSLTLPPSGSAEEATYGLRGPEGLDDSWGLVSSSGESNRTVWALNNAGRVARLKPDGTLERISGTHAEFRLPSSTGASTWAMIALPAANRATVAGTGSTSAGGEQLVIAKLKRTAKAAPPRISIVGLHRPRTFEGVVAKGITVTYRCSAACKVKASIRVPRRLQEKLRLSSPVIGSGRAHSGKGRNRLTARLNKKAIRAIRRSRPHSVRYHLRLTAAAAHARDGARSVAGTMTFR